MKNADLHFFGQRIEDPRSHNIIIVVPKLVIRVTQRRFWD